MKNRKGILINNAFQKVLHDCGFKTNKIWVDKGSKFYSKTMKIKFFDVKPSTYIDFDVDHNHKDPKFKVGYYVRILKYINIYGKFKNIVPWTYVIYGEKIVGTFYKEKLGSKR